jgi:hypothetical protein
MGTMWLQPNWGAPPTVVFWVDCLQHTSIVPKKQLLQTRIVNTQRSCTVHVLHALHR